MVSEATPSRPNVVLALLPTNNMLLHPASSSFDVMDASQDDESSASPLFDSVRDLDAFDDQSWESFESSDHDRPTFVP